MFCTQCGKEFEDDNKFCPFCGAEVEIIEEETEVVKPIEKKPSPIKKAKEKAPKEPRTSKEPKEKSSKRTGLIIAIVAIIAALGVGGYFLYQSLQPTEMDICSIMSEPSINGYNEYAVLDALTVDQDKAEELIAVFDEADQAEIREFINSVTFVADKTDKLCNGDEITVVAVYDSEKAEELKLEITGESTKITVEGLEEGQDLAYQNNKTAMNAAWEDFVFPDSDHMYIDEEELEFYSAEEIQTGINEIYARHGYIFETQSINQYFKSFSWYTPMYPKAKFNSAWFNNYESSNIALLSRYR